MIFSCMPLRLSKAKAIIPFNPSSDIGIYLFILLTNSLLIKCCFSGCEG